MDLELFVLFNQISVCPLCGRELSLNEEDESKSCPEGDGEAYVTTSADGYPTVMFETRRAV